MDRLSKQADEVEGGLFVGSWRLFVLALVLVTGVGCAGPGSYTAQTDTSDSDSILITTDENETATDQLYRFLKSHGYKVRRVSNTMIAYHNSGLKFLLAPKVFDDRTKIDRLVMYVGFSVKPEYQNSPEMQQKIMELNKDYNFACFYLEDTMFFAMTQMTFLDRFTLREFDAFVNSFREAFTYVIAAKNLPKYLQ